MTVDSALGKTPIVFVGWEGEGGHVCGDEGGVWRLAFFDGGGEDVCGVCAFCSFLFLLYCDSYVVPESCGGFEPEIIEAEDGVPSDVGEKGAAEEEEVVGVVHHTVFVFG